MPENHRTPNQEPGRVKTRMPYRKPRLEKHGHMAEVTQKSGTSHDNSQSWPTKK